MDIPSIITVRDVQMVYIPPGKFLMGKDGWLDLEPRHEVHVDGFYISRYPVTNAQYREFGAAKAYRQPSHWKAGTYPKGSANHPVVYVSWHDALAYCRWLSQETGRQVRLPTEAQWEKAARGTDGRRYPWGDDFDKSKCNTKQSGIGGTTPVGKYSPQGDSPYGVGDMAGNVWEWCSSLFMPYPCDPDDARDDLEARGNRVVRGGAFGYNHGFVRCASRYGYDPDNRGYGLGFRVIVSPGSPE